MSRNATRSSLIFSALWLSRRVLPRPSPETPNSMDRTYISSTANSSPVTLVHMSRLPEEGDPLPNTHLTTPAAPKDDETRDREQAGQDQPSPEDTLTADGDHLKEYKFSEDTRNEHQTPAAGVSKESVASTSECNSSADTLDNDSLSHTLPPTSTPSPQQPPFPPSSPLPQQPHNSESSTTVVVIVLAALSQMSIGATLTWPHILFFQLAVDTTTFFSTDLHISNSQVDLTGYLFLAGLVVGLTPTGWMVDTMGRWRSLVTAAFAGILSWTLNALTPNVTVLLVGGFVSGLAAAMLNVSVTTYVTEASAVSYRGQTLACLELMKTVGALVCLSLTRLLPWYHIAFAHLGLLVVCAGAFIFFPESPAYLVAQRREQEALGALKKLRVPGYSVEEELQLIKHYNTPEDPTACRYTYLFKKRFLPHLSALVGLLVVSTFSGSAVITKKGADLLLAAGLSVRRGLALLMVLVALIAGTFALAGLVDRIGRRMCLLLSLMILVVAYSVVGAMEYVSSLKLGIDPLTPGRDLSLVYINPNSPTVPTSWVAVQVCFLLVATFSLTLGTYTVPTILSVEYFPAYCRPQGLAVFLTVSVLLQAVSLHVQPLIVDTLGLPGLYWFFGGVALLGILYTNFCVHEVKYKTHRVSTVCNWLFKENFYEPRPLI